ncbi:MAG: hypothetical protein JW774_05110, partial [Candidatus Aureabacteria bacterium]|nr:hypothetical protein [Candidatus Auribacterota bacterium]
ALAMDQILEGTYKYDGLREVLEITKAEPHGVSYVPWWEQKIASVVPGQKIRLLYQYNPSAPVPVAQIWSSLKKQFLFTEIDFFEEEGEDQIKKNYIVFHNDVPAGTPGRVFFYPEMTRMKEVEMTIFLDEAKGEIVRRYKGEVKPLIKMPEGVRISRFDIEYLNGANSVIGDEELKKISPMNNPITAVRLFVTAEKGSERFTLRSFVNIRKKGSGGNGFFLTEGAVIGIPNAKKIKTLSLTNFAAVLADSTVICDIRSANENKTYRVRIKLTRKNNIPWLLHYDIECPIGEIVYSQDPDAPAYRGFNFLTADRSGRYDYGVDENAAGEVVFASDDVQFKLTKADIGSVNLLIR